MAAIHSEWFPHETPPVRAGVYQRDYGEPGAPDLRFCWFDGAGWFASCSTPAHAKAELCPSMAAARWRGLTIEEFTQRHRDASRALARLIWDSKP